MRPETLQALIKMHHAEATDQLIYAKLGARMAQPNRDVLLGMAADEERHCRVWGNYTKHDPQVNMLKVRLYILISYVFGITFILNQLEKDEGLAAGEYKLILEDVPEARQIMEEEERHEEALAAMIQEEKLQYIGSMVLGLSDALVELTGALAGFTLALSNNATVGLAGFITGVAATLSMAASEYLSKKADPGEKHPLKAAIYTGIAYMVAVSLLLFPYVILSSPIMALAFCLFNASVIIFIFTYFVSVIQKEAFKPKFFEMLTICFVVAAISFLIGWAAKNFFGLEL